MKLPIKHIAILVIASLIAIFAYQTYWLVSMYHTMKTDMEHSITEAMRTCDYNEMMLRIECMRRDDKDHGEISVSAGYNDEGGTLVRSSTTVHKEKVPKGMDVQQDTILRTEKKLDTLIVVRNDQREIKVIPQDSTSQEVKTAMLQTGLHPRTGCTYLRLYFRHPFTLALPPPDGFCSRSYCPADGWYTYYFIYHFVDIRILFLVLDPYIAETENTGRNEK